MVSSLKEDVTKRGRGSNSGSGRGVGGRSERTECPYSGEFVKNGKRYIRLVGRDSVRDLLIPDQGPNTQSTLFCRDEFLKFHRKTEVVTPQQKANSLKAAKDEKAKKVQESVLRRKMMESFPTDRNFGPILTKMENEASRKANHLLERVREVKREQSDEIKTCNTIILGKKCQAIRDAQIAEKRLLEKELAAEEKRLDKMMDEELKMKEWEEETRRRWERERRMAFREALLQQIRDNQLQRELAAERIEEEQRLMNEAAMQVQINCLEERKQRQKEQAERREEMNRINSEMLGLIEKERRDSKLAELRVQECIRLKEEAEESREREKLMRKLEKEKELNKLRDSQQQMLDKKARRDEMEAKRVQGEVERRWRAKEAASREEVRRRSEELLADRRRQAEERRVAEAAEIEEERMERERGRRLEEQAKRAEEERAREKRELLVRYREDLLKQINEKEKERIKSKKSMFEDGLLIQMEEKIRRDDLKETMMKKVAEIRTHNIPESYIHDVERKLQLK